jgi:hypothetical protein
MRSVMLFFVLPFVVLCALAFGLAVYVEHAAPLPFQTDNSSK